jgi:hypothetical protein
MLGSSLLVRPQSNGLQRFNLTNESQRRLWPQARDARHGPGALLLGVRACNHIPLASHPLILPHSLYAGALPALFNVFSLLGYLVLNCIIGGQTLAAVSTHLNATLGIVIIAVISLCVTFLGYHLLHWYGAFCSFPVRDGTTSVTRYPWLGATHALRCLRSR